MTTRYSPARLKNGQNEPIITTKTFDCREKANYHGINNMKIAEEDLYIQEIEYEDDSWMTLLDIIKAKGGENSALFY